MDNTLYNNYKRLVDSLDYRYKGYDLKKLLPGYLNFVFADEYPSVRDVFKEFYLGAKLIDYRKLFESETPVLITYSIDRDDYRDLAKAAKKNYPDSEVINLSSLPVVGQSMFSISFLKHFFIALKIVFFGSVKTSFMTKLYLVALIVKLFNQITLLEKVQFTNRITQYICFNSAYKEESLLTEFFNKRKIETISLQHGIFCDFKLFTPFDYINFDNFLSQKLLCWGQSTVDYLVEKGLDESRLILMGNPKYNDVRIETGEVDQSFNRCLVLLGRGIYTETNEKLLALLKEYNRKHKDRKILFYLKKHPFLMDSDHKSFASIADNMVFLGKEHSVQEVLGSDMVNFSIAVNTTAYYESLALGKASFRWCESENEEFFGLDDKFSSLSELEAKIDQFKQMPKGELAKKMQDVIKYVFNPQL